MWSKSEIWKHYGVVYQPHNDAVDGTDQQHQAKSKYCKCSACDEPVIAASGRLRDHWNKCTKRPRAIGQLDAGFVPSRNVMVKKQKGSRSHNVDMLSSSSSHRRQASQGSGTAACSASSTRTWSSSTTRNSSQLGLGAFSPSGDTNNDSSFFPVVANTLILSSPVKWNALTCCSRVLSTALRCHTLRLITLHGSPSSSTRCDRAISCRRDVKLVANS